VTPNSIHHERLRVLFIPVSAPRGSGEYARALTIAQALQQHSPHAEIRFIISAAAPYADRVPFTALRLARSPTLHRAEVSQYIHEFKPHIVVFDNAGRTQHLRAARACGARIIYISSRPRQRAKAFRLRWMQLLDAHWIAYPEIVAGSLTLFERIKLRLTKKTQVRFVNVLLPAVTEALTAEVLQRFQVKAGEYVLIAPGGGTAHPSMKNGPQVIAQVAANLAQSGHATILLGVKVAAQESSPQLRQSGIIPTAELRILIQHARVVICNGADTLLQVIALGKPCMAVAMFPDQVVRLQRLAAVDVDLRVPLDAAQIVAAAQTLLGNEQRRDAVQQQLQSLNFTNDLPEIVSTLTALAPTTLRPSAPLHHQSQLL
jgi:predicted glycosyltransferase